MQSRLYQDLLTTGPRDTTGRKIDEIDALRAVAVLSVIVGHFHPNVLPGGFLGVDVFFVISGFVITSSFLSGGNAVDLKSFLLQFYKRRFKRLFPALFLCVVTTCILISFFSKSNSTYLNTGLTALIGFSNLYLTVNSLDYWSQTAELNPFTHTWSLAVEEQFYLVYPLIFWAATRGTLKAGNRGKLLSVILALSLLSLGALCLFAPNNPDLTYYNMPFRFWELGLGCACALLRPKRIQPIRMAKVFNLPNISLFLIFATFFIDESYFPGSAVLVTCLTSILLVSVRNAALQTPNSSREKAPIALAFLRLPQVIYLGRISYSLYLWHWSVLVIGKWTVGLQWWSLPIQYFLIAFLSVVSYHFVEQPLRYGDWSRFKGRFVTRRAVLAASAIPLLFVLMLSDNQLFLGKKHRSPDRTPYLESTNCGEVRGTDMKLKTLGNSHARHIVPLLSVFSKACHIEIWTPVKAEYFIPSGKGLQETDKKILDDLLQDMQARDLLVISSRNRYLYETPFLNLTGDRWMDHANEKSQRGYGLTKWLEELDYLLEQTAVKDVNVVLFMPIVEFDTKVLPNEDSICEPQWFRIVEPACFNTVSSDFLDARFSQAFEIAVAEREQRTTNLFVYDPMPVFCTTARCERVIDNVYAFRDTNHLTVAGALMMHASFNRFLIANGLLKNRPN